MAKLPQSYFLCRCHGVHPGSQHAGDGNDSFARDLRVVWRCGRCVSAHIMYDTSGIRAATAHSAVSVAVTVKMVHSN
eukprot:363265-Chlamydomonas_euryale.AAC.2